VGTQRDALAMSFALDNSGALEVLVIRGDHLPGRDMYVRVQLGEVSRKTFVKSSTGGDPVWNQKLLYNLSKDGGEQLQVAVMESNTFVADEWLCGLQIPLNQLQHNTPFQGHFDLNANNAADSRTLELSLCWRSYQHMSHVGRNQEQPVAPAPVPGTTSGKRLSVVGEPPPAPITEARVSKKTKQILGLCPNMVNTMSSFAYFLVAPSDAAQANGVLARKHKIVINDFIDKDVVLDRTERNLLTATTLVQDTEKVLDKIVASMLRCRSASAAAAAEAEAEATNTKS
jgi:hypothetical protein